MFEKAFLEAPPLRGIVKIMLTIWCMVLVPWLPVFSLMGTGMAFEGGYTFSAYAFVVMAWTYPVLVMLAFFFRRRRPNLVWLPILTAFPWLASVWPNNYLALFSAQYFGWS